MKKEDLLCCYLETLRLVLSIDLVIVHKNTENYAFCGCYAFIVKPLLNSLGQ